MGYRKTNLSLISIMVVISAIITMASIGILYHTAFKQRRDDLVRTAYSQARMIEAMGRFDQLNNRAYPGGPRASTISKVKKTFESYQGVGKTGEFTLAQLDGNKITYLLIAPPHHGVRVNSVPMNSPLAEPMRRALYGASGTLVGLDYRNETVLAAYEPVADLDLGIVAKVDLAEVRAPFIRAGGVVALIALALGAAGAVLFLRVSYPLIEDIRASEEKYRNLVNGSIAGIIIFQRNRVAYANPMIAKILGYPLGELVGLSPVEKLLHPEEVERMRKMRVDLPAAAFVFRGLRRDGSTVWLKSVARSIDWDGEPTVQLTVLDITKRQRIEETKRITERRFRKGLENIAIGIVVADEEGVIKVFNRTAEKIFGYQRNEVVGRNVAELTSEEDRDHHNDYISRYLKTGERKIIGISRVVTGRRKNGETFPVRLTVSDMGRDETFRFIATFHDLTEVKALEKQLFRAKKMEALGEVSSGVAHDFNNLLSMMQGNLELAADHLPRDDKARKNLDKAMAAVKRCSDLIRSLLAFSRKQLLAPKPVDANEQVSALEELLRRTLEANIEIDINLAPDLWSCKADPGELENALLNLALNARDAMSNGGKLTIETANVALDDQYKLWAEGPAPGDYVVVTMTDTGPGMSPEVLERVFEPFFTTKKPGHGTGLGLSMVYGFAKQSNGYIDIGSELDHGTTARLYLPKSAASAVPLQTTPYPVVGQAQGELVFVLEDDEDVCAMTKELVLSLGYQVRAAHDAETALAHLEREPEVAILLTDVFLGEGMTGPDVAVTVLKKHPEIKIVFMTGYTDKVNLDYHGPGDNIILLHKPFTRGELAQKLRATLETSQLTDRGNP